MVNVNKKGRTSLRGKFRQISGSPFTISENTVVDMGHKETGKFIPQSVVDDMEKIFSFPTENEGFDKIIEVNR